MTSYAPQPGPRSLILVAHPDAKLHVTEEGIVSFNKLFDLAPLLKFIASERLRFRPLFSLSGEVVNWKTSILKALKSLKEVFFGKPIGLAIGLSLFYKVEAPDEMLEWLAERLREYSVFQAVYIKPGAEPPVFDFSIEVQDGIAPGSAADGLTSRQGYLNEAASGGVNAVFAWGIEGGGGQGVNIIDVEGAWRFSHEDLRENQGGVAAGVPIASRGWRNHGTAVLGVFSGDRNDFGITGICPDAFVRGASIFGNSEGTTTGDWGSAAAIQMAADLLNPGDIMLIELHRPGPKAQFKKHDSQIGYIPAEWWPDNLLAIKYATSKGIIVVEAGGNGAQNLDDGIYDKNPPWPNGPFPEKWHNPFRRDPIDSGAILVGAGEPPDLANSANLEPDSSRLASSNFGSVIDVQGWGDEVTTSGYGGMSEKDPNEDRWYTSRFNGTSSAAAMIAGVLGSLQGVAKARGGLLTPERARALLRNEELREELFLKHQGGDSQNIGLRPDLKALINSL